MRRFTGMRAAALLAAGLSACTGSIPDRGGGSSNGGDNGNGSDGTGATGATGVKPGTGGAGGTGMGGGGNGSASAEAPGRTPMRRLTHAEYNNTIRDLFGLHDDFASAFSGDDDAGGFAANTESPVSEDQADQYHVAADAIPTKAIAGGLGTLAPCAPPAGAADACADQFVRSFGRRAFRRPLTTEEVARYKTVYTAGAGGADFASGLQLVITAMLESPNFLYLPERGDKKAAEKDGLPLDPYETAARLSYFLIGSTPDDQLSAAADAGALRTPDQVLAQGKRLLASTKARDSMASFFTQWLEMGDLGAVSKDQKLFPQFTPAVATAMTAELADFSSRVTLEGAGKLETLLTADYSFPAAPLAPIYGLPASVRPDGTAQIAFPKGQRSGLFTLAAVMTLYAHADQSGPVGRGFLVSEKLLCNTPPAPPPNVPPLPAADPNVTTRERLEKHRSDPACATCHAIFDPFGLTFEIYDGIGRYRTMDGNKAVDATGKDLPNGLADVKDATELMSQLAKSDAVRSCLARSWFRYAFGRVETPQDDATLSTARAAFARADFVTRDLLLGLATSRGFRYRALPRP
jgi:hypothetical protein